MKKLIAIVAAGLLVLSVAATAFAGTVSWSGVNGWPIEVNCSDVAPGEILWIYTGDSDSPVILTIDGIQYGGEQKGNGSWHIFTPWPNEKPTVTLDYTGEYDHEGVLTISHGCPAPTPTPEVTPTPTPEVTPTPTPEVTPTPTPEVTPTPTPEVTPTPTPEVTPTPTPEVTPTPTPSDSATPSVVPSVTPDVTPPATDTAVYDSSQPAFNGLALLFIFIIALATGTALMVPRRRKR